MAVQLREVVFLLLPYMIVDNLSILLHSHLDPCKRALDDVRGYTLERGLDCNLAGRDRCRGETSCRRQRYGHGEVARRWTGVEEKTFPTDDRWSFPWSVGDEGR
jgi:hypothetical protein